MNNENRYITIKFSKKVTLRLWLQKQKRIFKIKLFNIYPEIPPGYWMNEKGEIGIIEVKRQWIKE